MAFRGGTDLWIVPPQGCDIQVTHDIDASQPAWSPDGGRLAFGAGRTAEPADIWVVNVNGTGLRQLTADPEADQQPTWSPDGAWIAWSRKSALANASGRCVRMDLMRSRFPSVIQGNSWIRRCGFRSGTWRSAPARPRSCPIRSRSPEGTALPSSGSTSRSLWPSGRTATCISATSNHPSPWSIHSDGTSIAGAGQGSGDGKFDFGGPDNSHASIAVGPDGRVYVSDSQNARVQVFGPTGKYVRQFGRAGTGDGEFTWSFDLSVDAAGNVYVIDDEARNLQKFSPTGRLLWKVDRSTRPDMTGHGHDANIDSKGRIVVGNDDTGRVLYLDTNGTARSTPSMERHATLPSTPRGTRTSAAVRGDFVDVFDPSHRLIGRWSGPAHAARRAARIRAQWRDLRARQGRIVNQAAGHAAGAIATQAGVRSQPTRQRVGRIRIAIG